MPADDQGVTLLSAPTAAVGAPLPGPAPQVFGTGRTLLLISVRGDVGLAESALRRESRSEDDVTRRGDDLTVLLAVLPADLDAVADRLVSAVERATGAVAAAGLCTVDPRLDRAELLRRARLGVSVAWACGGSRAVRHP